MAMFRYACLKQGIDTDTILIENAGNGAQMDAAFRAGRGDYIHQQGPAPQQLEHDGVGHVVAALVIVIPRSFSWGIQSISAVPSCTSPILYVLPV